MNPKPRPKPTKIYLNKRTPPKGHLDRSVSSVSSGMAGNRADLRSAERVSTWFGSDRE